MKSAELRSFRKYTREAGTTLPASGKKNWFLSIIMIAIASLLLSIISGPALVFAESSGIYWTDYASEPTLSGTTYTITSAGQLAWVAKQVNAGNDFAGYTIEISDGLSSIDLSAHYWEPIGYTTYGANVDRTFSGTFNGNKIPISNLKIGTSENPESKLYYVGLFGYTKKAEIKNTRITNAAVYYSQNSSLSTAGTLIGYAYASTITDCSSTGNVTCGDAAVAGGLAGRLDSCVAKDSWSLCAVTVETSADPAYVTQYAGGFAGAVNNSTISGCFHTTGNVQSDEGRAHVGGLIGNAESVVGSYADGCFYSDTVLIKNCYATGNVTGGAASAVGGLAGSVINGFVTGSHASVRVTGGDTNTEGTDDTSFVGGLVGYACTVDREGNPDLVVTDCYATGEVSGTINCSVGGLAGFSSDLTDCHATGSVTGGNGSNVGGLAGCAEDVTDCYAIGNVVSTSTGYYIDLGGLAGDVDNVTNCYATGNVKGEEFCRIGGLAGYTVGDIKNSYATGSVITEGEAIDAGGLAGMVDGAGNDLINSCATGNVSIERGRAGGLAAEIVGNIVNCYAAGAASSAEPDRQLGGLLFSGMYGTSVSPAYWNSDTNSIGVVDCQDDFDYHTGTEIKFVDTSTGVPSAYMQSSAFVDALNAFAGSHAGLKEWSLGNDSYPTLEGVGNGGNETPVTSVSLNKSTVSVNSTSPVTLTAAISPSKATIQNVAWRSSDPAVAAVSYLGVVTGVTNGTVVVTATTVDGGYTAFCTVTVTMNSEIPVGQTAIPVIIGIPTEGDINVHGTATLGASIVLSINGIEQPAVIADASTGSWNVTGLTLVAGDNISVTAQITGETVSAAATATVAAKVDECFIATAAFGSKFDWPVALLRHFRDQYLLTNSVGTAFVNFYYQNSPPIAAFIAGSQPLKALVRVLLAPVIAIVYMIYHPMLMGIAMFIIFLICLYWLRRRYIFSIAP